MNVIGPIELRFEPQQTIHLFL